MLEFKSDYKFEKISSMRFENLSFSYDNGTPIFNDVSCEIPINTNVFVTGNGGSGLSTFLKLLAVLIQPGSGNYFINSHDTTMMSFEDFLPIRMKIGYSFDYGGLFANRTLHDNLTLPLLYHKRCSLEEADQIARDLATEFGFERQVMYRPALVSGGLRKLICVLRAFVMRPQMVVMDDPFTGIGMEASRKLVRMIMDRRESGELQHVFLSSRDEVWPHWLGCDTIQIERGSLVYEARKAA